MEASTTNEQPAAAPEQPEPSAEQPTPFSITADVPLPPRTRNFTDAEARQVLAYLNGEAEGQTEPAKNVGYGEYDSATAARSAGHTLNRLLSGLGAPHKYSITTRERNGKHVGVILNQPAKQPPPPKGQGKGRARNKS